MRSAPVYRYPAPGKGRNAVAFVLAAASAVFFTSPAGAQTEYKYTNLADTNGIFSNFEVNCATLNSDGTVAFSAPLKAGGRAIYKWSGGALQKIAKTGETIDTIPIVELGNTAFVDSLGNVAFNVTYGQNTEVIYKSSGGTPEIVSGYFYYSLTPPAISSSGKVAWTGFNGFQNSEGVDTSRYYVLRNPANGESGNQGNAGAIIAHSGGEGEKNLTGYFQEFVRANISDTGSVVFRALIRGGGEGIFIGKEALADRSIAGDKNTTKIADSVSPGSTFNIFGIRPDINNSDVIAFGAQLKNGGRVICKAFAGGSPSVYLDDTGAYNFLGVDPAINDAGTVSFVGRVRQTGKAGVFTGPDPLLDTVIQTGASLFGSTLVEVGGGPRTLSNKGQVVFLYKLADGRTGLALAEADGAKKPTGDLAIKEEKQPDSAYSTRGVFLRGAAGTQLKEVSFEPEAGSSAVFNVELTNTATEAKQYAMFGSETGDTGWTVQAFLGTTDYWSALKNPGALTPVLAPGGKFYLRVVVTGTDSTKALPYNTKHGFVLAVTAADNTSFTHDAVGADVKTVKALIVNSTGDEAAVNPSVGPDVNADKPGDQITLRSAIQFANHEIGKDIIKFKIPDDDPNKESGVWMIRPESGLPAITEPVTIDGRTQDANSLTPAIELDGSRLPRPTPSDFAGPSPNTWESLYDYRLQSEGAASGLVVALGGYETEIYNLAVTSFPFFGVEVHGSANQVQGCHIGIDAAGLVAKANGRPSQGSDSVKVYNPTLGTGSKKRNKGGGILVKSSGNHIGGQESRARNLISGTCTATLPAEFHISNSDGILITGSGATGNVIEGNYFGLDKTGESAPQEIAGASQTPDAVAGVTIYNASSNTIGGLSAAARNVFAGSADPGYVVVAPADGVRIIGQNASGNVVQGNTFGASASYSKPLPNTYGILIDNASANLVGGTSAAARNYVVAAAIGTSVHSSSAAENEFINNVFGLSPNGAVLDTGNGTAFSLRGGSTKTTLLSNIIRGWTRHAIQIEHSSGNTVSENQIHGTGSLHEAAVDVLFGTANLIEANTIYDNPGPAIAVLSDTVAGVISDRIRISRNAIYNNEFGISLTGNASPLANDLSDGDQGSNGLLNYPVLNAARIGSGLTIEGALSTNIGSRTYHIEFFANRKSPKGYGEGERYLGALDVTTGVGGQAQIAGTINSPVQVGEFITATATDPIGNTSEFSKAIPARLGVDLDNDGVDDELELKVPNLKPGGSNLSVKRHASRLAFATNADGTGDGNGDGVADAQQANVASLLGIAGTWLTLAAEPGISLTNVEPSGPPDFTALPEGYIFPAGFLSFTAAGIPPGGSTTINEILHTPINCVAVFAYGPTPDNNQPHWYRFDFDGTTGAQIGNGEISLTFKDGGRGDHDLQANGQVTTVLAPAVSTSSVLLNIATRMRVQTGENVLIGGFIITGMEPKKVIIRGIGPSLAQFFNGTLTDPLLELFQGNTSLALNDNWKENQAEVAATGIPPNHDLESAIVYTLAPGAYTAVLRGSGGATGIGVVEAYDLSQGAAAKLANIATRGLVETGDDVMIGGFIIGGGGGTGARVVIRAIGPSLAAFGIGGVLDDPTLDLKDANGTTLSSNNDWITTRNEIEATGLAPNVDREAALVADLPGGNYTAIVSGVNGGKGVAVVEVYHLQ